MQQAPAQSATPITRAEFNAMHFQRNELKDQLNQITRRRNTLQEQMLALPENQRADHQARIREIDKRASDIDRAVMRLDIQIADASGRPIIEEPVVARSTPQPDRIINVLPPTSLRNRDVERAQVFAGLAFTAVAVYAIFLAARRFFLKPSANSLEGQGRRLDQLQQSVDVIALEVERMSESQRFVAKVLNDKLPALGLGNAQHIASPAKDTAKV